MVETGDAGSAVCNGQRYNAVTHGLTAKTEVLPGDDLEAFLAHVEVFKEGLGGTRSKLEDELAKKAALASWQVDRASRSEGSRLSRDRIVSAEADALRERQEAIALGNRLSLTGGGRSSCIRQQSIAVVNRSERHHRGRLMTPMIRQRSCSRWRRRPPVAGGFLMLGSRFGTFLSRGWVGSLMRR